MYDFQHYHDARQAGYDPNIIGKVLMRNVRNALKGYVKHAESLGSQNSIKTKIQELYASLSRPLELQELTRTVDSYIDYFNQLQGEDRKQNGIINNVVHVLMQLRDYINN